MSEEQRQALREEEKEARRARLKSRLGRLWRTLAWAVAPLSAAWLVFLAIVFVSEKLYSRPGEIIACAALALPGLILLILSAVTLRRAGREKKEKRERG